MTNRLRAGRNQAEAMQEKKKILDNFFDTSAAPQGNPYDLIKYIGKGAYGEVVMAQHKFTRKKVAMKRIKKVIYSRAMAVRILRELKLLRLLSAHENIITVKDVLVPSDIRKFDDVFVVFELMPADLSRVLRSNNELRPDHIKWFMFQILRGVHFMHVAGVLHRDLKPNNIMINGKCELRIIDLGLARARFQDDIDAMGVWTNYVATRWYRAPELVLKHDTLLYSYAIDIWSIGCIFAELLTRGHVLFPGKNTRDQYEVITDVLGTPSPELQRKLGQPSWGQPGVSKRPKPFGQLFPRADPLAVDLLQRMLVLDPDQRVDTSAAMEHPYFSEYRHLGFGTKGEVLSSDDFEFERLALNPSQLRQEFMKEILHYHPEKTMRDVLGSSYIAPQFDEAMSGNAKRRVTYTGMEQEQRYDHTFRQVTGPHPDISMEDT